MTTGPDIAETSTPTLPPNVELRYDEREHIWTVSIPARIVAPDDIAIEILKRCDGRTSVASMVDELCQIFSAGPDQVADDVQAMLQDLAERGMVQL
jgi:pyrroloquinoline quinone biosynthesis protein D